MTRLLPLLVALLAVACDRSAKNADTFHVVARDRSDASLVVTPHGVGDVRAGMTLKALQEALPSLVASSEAQTGACGYATSTRLPDSVAIMFDAGQVARVEVRGGSLRTAEGIGIGDSETQVKNAYAGRVAITPHKYTAGHYLTVKPAVASDTGFAIVFETDGERVVNY